MIPGFKFVGIHQRSHKIFKAKIDRTEKEIDKSIRTVENLILLS